MKKSAFRLNPRIRTAVLRSLFFREKPTVRFPVLRILARSVAGAMLVSFSVCEVALAQNREAECNPVQGNPAVQVCTGSDYTGIRFTPQDVPPDGLDLTVQGGTDEASAITINGQGLQVPLPNGQSIEVMDHGISVESAADSAVSVTLEGHARIQTDGVGGHGINVRQHRAGPLNIAVTGGTIATGGQGAHGVNGEHLGTGDISITLGRGTEITPKRAGSNGVQGFQHHDGSVTVRLEEGAVVRGVARGGRGVAAFLTNDENSGRIVIDNKGTILGGPGTEGILAWARRRSGHTGYTMENGQTADPVETMNDGVRDKPLIHIVSSGTIRVGDPSIVGLPGQPDPAAFAQALNLGIVGGLLKPPLPPVGAGIRAYAVDLVDLLDHVATPKTLTSAELTILAAQLQIPAFPGLTPAQVLAGALGAVDAQGNPLPVKVLSPAEAALIREVVEGDTICDDADQDCMEEALDGLTASQYTDDYKNKVREFAVNYNAGDILIEVTGGSVTSLDGYGMHAGYPIPSAKNGRVLVSVSEGAVVTGLIDGIRLGTGGIVDDRRQQIIIVEGEVIGQTGVGVHPIAGGDVTIRPTGKVSGYTGVYFEDGSGNGDFDLTNNVVRVFGEVESTGPEVQNLPLPDGSRIEIKHAGIKLEGGGTVIVGPQARISAKSGVAILGEPWNIKPNVPADVEVVIQPGQDIQKRIQGVIRNLPGADGTSRAPKIYVRQPGAPAMRLAAGDDAVPLGVWDVILQQNGDEISVTNQCGARAQVYEALPFVLMGLTGLTTYQERMAAARDSDGVWFRSAYGGGQWNAKASTYGSTAYDYDRYELEGGIDYPVGKHGMIGASGYHRNSSVDVRNGGGLTLAGEGLGLSGTLNTGWFYVDSQLAMTWYRLNMDALSMGSIGSNVRGFGYALGIETGHRADMGSFADMGSLFLTPRAGVTYSSFSLDSFEARTGAGGGTVLMEDVESVRGRVGLLVEAGEKEARHLFASVDIEHEFSNAGKTVTVAGTPLAARLYPTRVRTGLGGSVGLGDNLPILQGSLSYTTAGHGNHDFLAEIRMKFNF